MSHVVSFYSFKGGVGRSQLLANVAVSLAQREFRVVCVDFDLTSGGLHNFFGLANNQLENTVLDLFDALSPEDVGRVAIDVTETAGVDSKDGRVWLLPTVAEPSKLSLTFEVVQEIGAKFAMILEEVDALFKPNFILVDCAAGFSELASGPILQADFLVCVLRPNRQNSDGMRMLLDILSTIGNSPAVLLVLNQVPAEVATEVVLATQTALGTEWPFDAIVPYIGEAGDVMGRPTIILEKNLTEHLEPILARLGAAE